MTEQELRQLFKNSSDCNADTWIDIGIEMKQGVLIRAMTEDKFIEIVTNLITTEVNDDVMSRRMLFNLKKTLMNDPEGDKQYSKGIEDGKIIEKHGTTKTQNK